MLASVQRATMGLLRRLSRFVLTVNALFLLLLGFSFGFGSVGDGAAVAAALALVPIALSTLGATAVVVADWDPL